MQNMKPQPGNGHFLLKNIVCKDIFKLAQKNIWMNFFGKFKTKGSTGN